MYKDYLKQWLAEEHKTGESPLSYQDWERTLYFSKKPTDSEWIELSNQYNHLIKCAKQIEKTRKQLFNNRAHRNLNSKNWKDLDRALFHIQSELCWSDSEFGFGAMELKDLCH